MISEIQYTTSIMDRSESMQSILENFQTYCDMTETILRELLAKLNVSLVRSRIENLLNLRATIQVNLNALARKIAKRSSSGKDLQQR